MSISANLTFLIGPFWAFDNTDDYKIYQADIGCGQDCVAVDIVVFHLDYDDFDGSKRMQMQY